MSKFTGVAILLLLSFSTKAQKGNEIAGKAYNLYRFFEKQHYKPVVWNDSSSSRFFSAIMEDADEWKLVFTKEDVKKLEVFRYNIDDEITKKGHVFIDAFGRIYRERLRTADSTMELVLTQKADLAKSEQIIFPFADYAADKKELFNRNLAYYKWRVLGNLADTLVKLKEKYKPAPGTVPPEVTALAAAELQSLKKAFDFNKLKARDAAAFDKAVGELYLRHISRLYDPHSDYMNFADKQQFESQVSATEYSAGIIYDKNSSAEWEIVRLVPGGPAWRSGELHEKDIIVSVKNGNTKDIQTRDLSEEQVDELIDGNAEERVTLTVKSTAGTQKTVNIVKEKLSSDADIVSSFVLEGNKKIGYIQLPGFYSNLDGESTGASCAEDVAKEIIKLKKDNVDGMILDLRNNGGGSMQEALELAGIFINEGILGMIKDNKGKVMNLRDPNRGTIYDGKLMILVNGASASASELTSAVLQDYNRALIVGGNTYGKGSAQIVLPLDTADNVNPQTKGEDFVKVTMRKFYRVNGTTVQWRGVVPDIVIPDIYQQEDIKERNEPQALLPDSIAKRTYNSLLPAPVADLAAASAARVTQNRYFTKINNFLTWSATKKQPRTIPLKWDQYATYYQTRNVALKDMEAADENVATAFKPGNNSIDKERAGFLSQQGKDINAYRVSTLQKDLFLNEAYQVMLDWINQTK